jgi:hypothetical protein
MARRLTRDDIGRLVDNTTNVHPCWLLCIKHGDGRRCERMIADRGWRSVGDGATNCVAKSCTFEVAVADLAYLREELHSNGILSFQVDYRDELVTATLAITEQRLAAMRLQANRPAAPRVAEHGEPNYVSDDDFFM